ncbi:hypothetical protein L596_007951 [Steinernema carpocapsae]|uniref:Uncharacterized protein n=1 Tax=Steinernema carpocapsae TaxID=34508 RepID=A0A4U5PB99_STECR|nr:hypothetical protein L596_007951 [Steinernema carpocapsae]
MSPSPNSRLSPSPRRLHRISRSSMPTGISVPLFPKVGRTSAANSSSLSASLGTPILSSPISLTTLAKTKKRQKRCVATQTTCCRLDLFGSGRNRSVL